MLADEGLADEGVDARAVADRRRVYRGAGKRSFDVVVALMMLVALWPLILLLLGLVARRGSSPIFGHSRIGREGETFLCYKIRSMVPDAEALLPGILAADPAAAAEWERERKLKNDPRVTRLGRFLRRTSLDELPQLWNVLRGDMSLVGPRPITAGELPLYGINLNEAYYEVRPGLTGIWQVRGRSSVDYADRVNLDLQYTRSLSFLGDVEILLATAMAVLRRTGT